MSTPGGGGASRGAKAKPMPPLKGSFPLDHFGECKDFMLAYAQCMKVWHHGILTTAALVSRRPPQPASRSAATAVLAPSQESGGNSSQCRELSKKYLDCRMNKCAPPLL
jgi:hypothetical protein